jgi:hypothetical protein
LSASSPDFTKVLADPRRPERAIRRTLVQSRSLASIVATVRFSACQGWGRGFESLRPLQISQGRFSIEAHGFNGSPAPALPSRGIRGVAACCRRWCLTMAAAHLIAPMLHNVASPCELSPWAPGTDDAAGFWLRSGRHCKSRSPRRSSASMHPASSSRRMNSSGRCARAMSPGPQTIAGMPACW